MIPLLSLFITGGCNKMLRVFIDDCNESSRLHQISGDIVSFEHPAVNNTFTQSDVKCMLKYTGSFFSFYIRLPEYCERLIYYLFIRQPCNASTGWYFSYNLKYVRDGRLNEIYYCLFLLFPHF